MKKQKILIQALLLTLIGSWIIFSTQSVQAGFFDWFSWSKIRSIILSEEVELPASSPEPPEEISPSKETAQEAQPETAPEKSAIIDKTTDKNSSEQEIIIQNLENQVASLKSQIKSLEKQIEDLLSKSPGLKEIVKEVPVEKIIYVDKPVIQECPVVEKVGYSESSLTIEKLDLSSDFLPTIRLSERDYLSMFTEAKFGAFEYSPQPFDLKKFTIKLVGTATNNDFLNASWRGKYFYKVGNDTLVWDHFYEMIPAISDCADFTIQITGIKNSHVSFQFQITEDSLEFVEHGGDKRAKIVGSFPINSFLFSTGT